MMATGLDKFNRFYRYVVMFGDGYSNAFNEEVEAKEFARSLLVDYPLSEVQMYDREARQFLDFLEVV